MDRRTELCNFHIVYLKRSLSLEKLTGVLLFTLSWKLGRIFQLQAGSEGIVTADSIIRRDVNGIHALGSNIFCGLRYLEMFCCKEYLIALQEI